MFQRSTPAWLAVLAASCATPSPRSADPAPRAEGAPDIERSEAVAESDPASPDPAPTASGASPASAGFDLDEWAFKHRIEIQLVADGCEPAQLAEPPDALIWCGHHQDQSQIVLHTRALYTVRAKKLVKLLELPVAVATLPNVEAPEPEADRFRVKLVFERAGKQLEVREAPGYDCAKARAANEEDKGALPALYKELAGALAKVCAQRGTWTFAGGTLTRRAPSGAPPR